MSAFTGMRKVTIRDTSTGNTGTFSVFNPSKIGTDGMTIPLETNETTTSSMAGDVVEPNGTNVGAATLQLIPVDKSDLAAVWPQGYDAETGTWQPPIGECIVEDVTIAFEKICDTKENVILRHAKIALSFELALTRDETFMPEVTFYPSAITRFRIWTKWRLCRQIDSLPTIRWSV
jgi:hypothetical protein